MPPTAVALAFTLWQLPYRPRAQYQHEPQKMLNGTITRSPTFRFATDGPTCSTTPTNSWPKVWPTRVSGTSPWYRCRSEPQIAARVTRTIASLGCSIAGISFSSTRTLYGPRYTIARIGWPPPERRGSDPTTRLLVPAGSASRLLEPCVGCRVTAIRRESLLTDDSQEISAVSRACPVSRNGLTQPDAWPYRPPGVSSHDDGVRRSARGGPPP